MKMVKQTDGKITPVSRFLVVIVLVMSLLSVIACSNGPTTQNPTPTPQTTPQPPNSNHLQNSYAAPNWWKPCILSKVIAVSINGVNRQVCTAWDQSQPAAQCDSINYQKFTGTAAIPLTSWRGIDVCGPRPEDSTSTPDHYTEFSSGGSVEQEFECTELVKRYLYLAYGLPSLGGTDGSQVVDNYTAAYSSLHKVDNHGTVQMFPTEGDILSFSGSNITHTAIVTGLTDVNNNGIGSATIHIIEQNWADTSGTRTLSMNKWTIGGSVISWMTKRPISSQSSPTGTSAPITVSMPPTQTSCPVPGTARAAVTRPLVLGTHQNIIYFENASPDGTSGTLKRYDVTTHQATDIVKKPDAYILEAQVSADGQWVLFISSVNGQPALQMVRMDGQGLQTLYCAPSNLTSPNSFSSALSNLVWSTDEQMVIFDQQGSSAPPTFLLLNLATGVVQIELQIDPNSSLSYTPRVWIDDTHLALFARSSSEYSQETSIYVLDTHNGANQHTNALQRIVTAPTSCFDFDISTDHTKFFLYRCTYNPSQSSRQGPSSISVIPVTGGTEHIIFASQTLAVLGLRVISDSGLLVLVGMGGFNSQKNGLYTIHIDGTNFVKFVGYDIFGIEARAMIFALYEFSPYPWSIVSRDGNMYAVVLVSDCGMHCQYTLLFGSLSGGKVTSLTSGLANSFGMVGWTTI
jgi:hypothetical protein